VPNRPQYIEFLIEQFAIMGEITTRAMFGGHMLYCDCVPFALVANNAVYLKADDHNRPGFLERGLLAFQPYPDKPGMHYYQIPPEAFEDPAAMMRWAGGAIAAGRRAQAKKSPSKKKR